MILCPECPETVTLTPVKKASQQRVARSLSEESQNLLFLQSWEYLINDSFEQRLAG
jgi:hypothetical protein